LSIETKQDRSDPRGVLQLDFYTKAYACSTDSVLLVEPGSFRVVYANPHLEKKSGYCQDELVGLDFRHLFVSEDRLDIANLFQSTLEWEKGRDARKRLRQKGGGQSEVEIATLLVDFNEKKAIFCNLRELPSISRAVSQPQSGPVLEGGYVMVSIAKLEALDERIFAKRETIPTLAVRKAISWLLQVPSQLFFDRLKAHNGHILFSCAGGETIPADARLFQSILEGLNALLNQRVDCNHVTFEAKAQAGITHFEFLFQGAELTSAEINHLKKKVEGRFSAQVVFSRTSDGVTKVVILVPPLQEPSSLSALYCGYFSSLTKKSAFEKAFEIDVETLEELDRLPKKRPLLVDLKGLDRVQSVSSDALLLSKVVVMDDYPSLESLRKTWVERSLRHFTFSAPLGACKPLSVSFLKATTQKFKRKEWRGLQAYLSPKASIQTSELIRYSERIHFLESIEAAAKQLGASALMQRLVCTAQEMIENAVFDAPQDGFGAKKYLALEDLVLKPHEKISISLGCDEDKIGISVVDPFGTLTYERVMKSMEKQSGFFDLFQWADGLVIHLKPGYQTEVICLFALEGGMSEGVEQVKCFSYFE